MHTIYGGWGLAPNYNCSFNFKFPEQFPVTFQYGGSRTGKVKLLPVIYSVFDQLICTGLLHL